MSLNITTTFVAHQPARASDMEQMKSDIQVWSAALEPKLLEMIERQGGSATDWTVTGVATQGVSGPIKVVAGMGTTGGTSTSGSFTFSSLDITFPTAFTYPPLIFANAADGTGWVKVGSSTTVANIILWGITSSTPDVASKRVQWIAIGI